MVISLHPIRRLLWLAGVIFLYPGNLLSAQTVLNDGFETRSLASAWGLTSGVVITNLGGASNGSDTERLVFEDFESHQSRQVIRLKTPVTTDILELRLVTPGANVPAALSKVPCYAD